MGSVIQGVSGMAAAKIGQSGTTDTNKVLTQPSTGSNTETTLGGSDGMGRPN